MVYIVEEHHHVLLPWALECQKSNVPFSVLTLDHHTDVLPAPENIKNTQEAVQFLRHDEHIDYALKTGIIQQSVIFSHVNYATGYHPCIQIVNFHNYPEYPTEDTREILYSYYSNALESRYLEKCLSYCNLSRPFVLDIDLDYFKTKKSVCPTDSRTFRQLVSDSLFVTIAKESDWVRLLNADWEKADALYMENELRRLFP